QRTARTILQFLWPQGTTEQNTNRMSLTQSNNDAPHIDKHKSTTPSNLLRTWLLTWEVYPILLVTGFLCLYRINTAEFNTDQAAIFSMARDAICFGLFPIICNSVFLCITNP